MNTEKRYITAGLLAGIIFAVCLFTFGIRAHAAEPMQPGELATPALPTTPPLAAVVVTNCGLAVALFIQLDATHLLRADPRQSDLFTAVDGKMVQSQAGPMPWNDAYKLALSAVLSSHVVIPCTEVTT